MSDWVEAQVVGKRRWNQGLYSLELASPPIEFIAGQFIKVALDVEGERIGRPYSLVNPPGEQPLEIFFTEIAEGPLTPRLSSLELGDRVWVTRKASGVFTLETVQPAETLWLFATGTGLGVYLSILGTPDPWRLFQRVILVHGVRHGLDLAYGERIQALAERYPGRLMRLAAVSREPWPGAFAGRITEFLTSGELERQAGAVIDPKTSHVMLCGNSAMIKDLKAILEARGLTRHRRNAPGQYTTEQYY